GMLDDMRSRQGGCLRGIVRRAIVNNNHLVRKLAGLQDDGADRWPFVEGGDGHQDLCLRKRPAQDRGDGRRRDFEHVYSYSSVKRPTRKPMLPSKPRTAESRL